MNDVLDTAPCGFVSFADDDTMLLINTTLLRLLGYERDQLLGRHVETLPMAGGRLF